MDDRRNQLAIYLRDHHAGSLGGRALVRRMFRQNRGTAYEADLRRIAAEIAEELTELRAIMRVAAVHAGPLKVLGAISGERLGRFKLNGSLTSYTPLARVLELELLSAAVTGKLRLWTGVRRILDAEGLRPGVDLDRLDAAARNQLTLLEELHRRATDEAFPVPGDRPDTDA